MALDVYVMPIWKFKAGDFESPLEALGVSPVIISSDGSMQRKTSSRPGLVTRWKAKRETRRLRREIEKEIGHPVSWNEDGATAYSDQAPPFEPLRAFAKWLDYRDMFPTFDAPPEDDYYKHPVMSNKLTRPLTYPQIVNHSCHTGYFIPTDLDRVVFVEPFVAWGRFEFKHSVGSTMRLLNELQHLGEVLNVKRDHQWEKDDPLAMIKSDFSQLYSIALISSEKNLPIIFYG
jgi:hypothetical protein